MNRAEVSSLMEVVESEDVDESSTGPTVVSAKALNVETASSAAKSMGTEGTVSSPSFSGERDALRLPDFVERGGASGVPEGSVLIRPESSG